MTPHPLATFAQLTVSPQRYATRQRRRRRAARRASLGRRTPVATEPRPLHEPRTSSSA